MSTPRPAEVLGKIPPAARQRRYLAPILVFALNYAAFAAALALSVILPQWWMKLACGGLSALFMGGLYVIAHDAGHGIYVPGRRLNMWVARLAFFPSLTPLAGWYRAHVLLHHNFLRVRGRDMVWMPWSLEEYRAASTWRRAWYRFLRTPVGIAVYWTVGNWLPYLLFPRNSELRSRRGQQRFDQLLVLGYVVLAMAGAYALNEAARDWSWAEPVPPICLPLLVVVFPYLIWSYSVAVVDLVHHTHPRAVWFSSRKEWDYYTANVKSTTNMRLPFGLGTLLHHILRHTAHHADPRVPLYHLPEAQATLEAAYPKDVIVEWFTPWYVLRVLRSCRLYDYSRRQWLDYDGTPTGPAQRPEEDLTMTDTTPAGIPAPAAVPQAALTDIVAAHRLIRDLFTPSPWRYWAELVLSGSAAWAAILVAANADHPLVIALAVIVAVPLWYRSLTMMHELTHQSRAELPGLHFAWNLTIGAAWFMPSIMYEGVHAAHHKKTTYGTEHDPEYLPLAGRTGAVLQYLGLSFVLFPALMVRFLVGAPVSWLIPPLRRFLIRSASSYVINLGFVRRMSRAERWRLLAWECVILLAWWPPLVLTFLGEISWQWLAVWYAVFTITALVNRSRMLAAHHFATEGHSTDHLGQFADSIDSPSGWLAEIWAPLGMRYHALHHLFPTLPFHNMGRAYRRLVANLPADSFYHRARGRGLFWGIARLLRSSR